MRDLTELENGYKIYQSRDGFRFSVDPVILSDFYQEKIHAKVLDIGTGNGIIPILLVMKNKAQDIVGVEIQKEVADLARENVELNGCTSKIRIVNSDIKDFRERNSFDAILSNPPYMEVDGKKINGNDSKSIARHEIALNLRELIENSKKLLKPRGTLYIVHRAYRLPEINQLLLEYGFAVEKIQMVYSSRGENANLALIKGCKGRKVLTQILEPLYLDERGY